MKKGSTKPINHGKIIQYFFNFGKEYVPYYSLELVYDNNKINKMMTQPYELEFSVRDYEVDLQGIVNNAVYQHYLEHARHEFLQTCNIDFAKLHDEGKDLVVVKVEMEYKVPLKSRDRFVVRLKTSRQGSLKIVFEQNIYRLPDQKLVVSGLVTGVCLNNGRPARPEDIIDVTLLGLE